MQLVCVFIMPCLLTSRDAVSAEAAGWLTPGVLSYFLDGLLPLLRVGDDNNLVLESVLQ